MPGSPAFGGGATETLLHPIVLIGMLIAMSLILALPRRYLIVPMLLSTFLMPLGQQVYAFGVHWLVCRMIVLVALMRVAMISAKSPKHLFAGGVNSIDRAFVGCVLCQSAATVLLYMQTAAVVNQIGFLIDVLGTYCVLRVFIQRDDEIFLAVKCLAIAAVILAIVMVREQITLQNAFGLLGGVPLASEIRDGKIRSRAAFQHPLTAGAFGGTLLPLFLMLWNRRHKSRFIATLGVAASTAMVLCSNSSTPLLAYVAGVFGLCVWPFRGRMKTIRWALVIVLIFLHLVMKAPVWFLIARIDLTGSSSGFHRAEIVDQFIRHWDNWLLIGTKDTVDWGFDIWDAQNEYVSVGETGGVLAFICFIAMISRAWARVGNARKLSEDKGQQWYFWFLGAALFSNVVAFFGVNYFDQSKVCWFVLLAIISAATSRIVKEVVHEGGQLNFAPELAAASVPSGEN